MPTTTMQTEQRAQLRRRSRALSCNGARRCAIEPVWGLLMGGGWLLREPQRRRLYHARPGAGSRPLAEWPRPRAPAAATPGSRRRRCSGPVPAASRSGTLSTTRLPRCLLPEDFVAARPRRLKWSGAGFSGPRATYGTRRGRRASGIVHIPPPGDSKQSAGAKRPNSSSPNRGVDGCGQPVSEYRPHRRSAPTPPPDPRRP